MGFEGHVPSQEQINLLLSHPDYKNWTQDIRILTTGLLDPCPETSEEVTRLAAAYAVIQGKRKLGHEIDLDRVTGRIVTFRKGGHVLVIEVGK